MDFEYNNTDAMKRGYGKLRKYKEEMYSLLEGDIEGTRLS